MRYLEKVVKRVQQVGNHLCVGIDPHSSENSAFLAGEAESLGDEEFLLKLSESILDGAAGAAAIKFQSAFFEAYGLVGLSVLERSIKDARARGFLAILDAKRGDISSTMHAYGVAAFDWMNADAMTVTAYMGTDVLDALRPWADRGRGVYVVWISSNLSGRLHQEAILKTSEVASEMGPEITVAQALQVSIDEWERTSGFAGMTGYVLGATKLDERLIASLGSTQRFFLIPGIGAQGGQIDNQLRGVLKKNPGSLVAMSRSLTGLGLKDWPAWQNISSWDDYTNSVSTQCAAAISGLKSV